MSSTELKDRSVVISLHVHRLGQSRPVVPTSEVIPSKGVRALEGEDRGLSHLEVIARGRLWRQLASKGID